MVLSALRDCLNYQFQRATSRNLAYPLGHQVIRLRASLSELEFHIKNPLPVFLAADWNFAYAIMQLFHGQASYEEANYNVGNYYCCVDDHTRFAIK